MTPQCFICIIGLTSLLFDVQQPTHGRKGRAPPPPPHTHTHKPAGPIVCGKWINLGFGCRQGPPVSRSIFTSGYTQWSRLHANQLRTFETKPQVKSTRQWCLWDKDKRFKKIQKLHTRNYTHTHTHTHTQAAQGAGAVGNNIL